MYALLSGRSVPMGCLPCTFHLITHNAVSLHRHSYGALNKASPMSGIHPQDTCIVTRIYKTSNDPFPWGTGSLIITFRPHTSSKECRASLCKILQANSDARSQTDPNRLHATQVSLTSFRYLSTWQVCVRRNDHVLARYNATITCEIKMPCARKSNTTWFRLLVTTKS